MNNFESSTHMNYLNPYIALGGRNPFRACFSFFLNKRNKDTLKEDIKYALLCFNQTPEPTLSGSKHQATAH